MVVNFRVCGISRGTHKLTRIPILNFKKKNTKTSATQIPLILFENDKNIINRSVMSKKTSTSGIMNQKSINRFRMKRQKATMNFFFFHGVKNKKKKTLPLSRNALILLLPQFNLAWCFKSGRFH
jgi:hypothetical protein